MLCHGSLVLQATYGIPYIPAKLPVLSKKHCKRYFQRYTIPFLVAHFCSLLGNQRWGVALGSGLKMEDSLWAGLTDSHAGLPMGGTAENLAEKVR